MIFSKASPKEAEIGLNWPRPRLMGPQGMLENVGKTSLVLPFLPMVTPLPLQITNDADSYIAQEDSQIKTR